MIHVRHFFIVLCTILGNLTQLVLSHARWKCPLPRDDIDTEGHHIPFENTGNKYGACGPMTGMWGIGSVTSLRPGWTTLVWEESVSHKGSPFRIALLDGTDATKMVLLDHIPHNDMTNPTENLESTYAPYRISLLIPDVNCPKCVLQLLYPMTDKSTKCGVQTCFYNPDDSACKGSTQLTAPTCSGAPNDNPCRVDNQCFSNYHSCTDVIIRGVKPLSSFQYDQQPLGWPYASLKPQYYSVESATWKDSWLQVPNMQPTYEPFITDFETLSCDRTPLKSSSYSNIPNTLFSDTTFQLESYGIVIMIIITFIAMMYFFIKKYYYTDNDGNNRENDFSTWIDTDLDKEHDSSSNLVHYENFTNINNNEQKYKDYQILS